MRACQHLLTDTAEDELGVLGDRARGPVDAADHVLRDGRGGPETLTGLAIEGVDDSGLSRNTGDDLSHFAWPDPWVDPAHRGGIGRDRRVHQQTLKRVVEVPVVVQVLVIPDDLAGIGIERERRVVIQVGVVDTADQELRRG